MVEKIYDKKHYKLLKRFILLIIVFQCCRLPLHAQSGYDKTRMVMLNDGSKIKGKIVKTVPGEYISLMLHGGQIIRIYQYDIKKIRYGGSAPSKTNFGKERGEVIFLKDGGSLFGKIIDQVPNDYVIIRLKNDDEVTFFAEEIARIKYNQRPRNDFYDKPTGFYHETDLGILSGEESISRGNSTNFSVHTVNGYRFRPWLQTGLGVGLDFQPNLHIVPFYLNIGGDIGRSKVVPVYFMNFGYSYAEERRVEDFELFDDVEGGKYFHLGAGVKIKISRMALVFKMGYKRSDVRTSDAFTDWTGRDVATFSVDRQIRRITATVGFSF